MTPGLTFENDPQLNTGAAVAAAAEVEEPVEVLGLQMGDDDETCARGMHRCICMHTYMYWMMLMRLLFVACIIYVRYMMMIRRVLVVFSISYIYVISIVIYNLWWYLI
jgi:hypothetical protein